MSCGSHAMWILPSAEPTWTAPSPRWRQPGLSRHSAGMDMFLDGPGGKARSAVRVIFSGEKVRSTDLAAIPDVAEAKSFTTYLVINLEGLVTMKLISFRDKDRTHLRDMIGVGLIDETWPGKFPDELGARLQQLIDDPNG